MKPKDLRIGNFVYLTKDNFITVKAYELDGYDIYKLSESDCADIKGIPISEEWLLKLGFQRQNHSKDWFVKDLVDGFTLYYNFGSALYKGLTLEGNGGYDFEGDVDLKHIKYVHQLQNLYFALTGEELTIKERE